MDTFETFITNSDKLPGDLETIRKQGVPEKFSQEFLTGLGFEKPNSILYVSLFKKLGLVDEDDRPHEKYYPVFAESKRNAKKLIARLVSRTYKDVFEVDKTAHRQPVRKIRDIFRELMGEEKSGTIVQLVADTFASLVLYADWKDYSPVSQNTKATQDESSTVSKDDDEEVELSAGSAHEEFILELMNGYTEHDYDSDGNGNGVVAHPAKANGSHHKEEVSVAEPEHVFSERSDSTGKRVKKKEKDGQPAGEKPDGSHLNHDSFFSRALVRRAELLARMERLDEAVSAYDDIILYSDRNECRLGEDELSDAYCKKAAMLEQMEKYEEALKTYDHFIQRFG